MAEEFGFELDAESASEADGVVVTDLRSQLSVADEEPARAFVNQKYQQFSDGLTMTVKRARKEKDIRQQWLEDCYWKTLQEYVADVKHAYVPHIDLTTVFNEDERQQMEYLHRKLSKQDQMAVTQLFKAEYDIYVDSLDAAVREACDVQKL